MSELQYTVMCNFLNHEWRSSFVYLYEAWLLYRCIKNWQHGELFNGVLSLVLWTSLDITQSSLSLVRRWQKGKEIHLSCQCFERTLAANWTYFSTQNNNVLSFYLSFTLFKKVTIIVKPQKLSELLLHNQTPSSDFGLRIRMVINNNSSTHALINYSILYYFV